MYLRKQKKKNKETNFNDREVVIRAISNKSLFNKTNPPPQVFSVALLRIYLFFENATLMEIISAKTRYFLRRDIIVFVSSKTKRRLKTLHKWSNRISHVYSTHPVFITL